jgi:hypothetical protein
MPCSALEIQSPLPPSRQSRDEDYDPALDRLNLEVAKLLGWSVERETVNDEQPRLISVDR